MEGIHHEIALPHERMRDYQVRRIDGKVVVEQDVDVDDAVAVLSVHRLVAAAHIALNLLCGGQHFVWLEGCLATDDGIDKGVFRLETPRLRTIESRLTSDFANLLSYFLDGLPDILLLLPQIRA